MYNELNNTDSCDDTDKNNDLKQARRYDSLT